MRSLLDTNFLIALADSKHIFHSRAQTWLADHAGDGWASCPLTENAFIRILSHPGYASDLRYSISGLAAWFSEFIAKTNHEFWPDKISLLDENLFEFERIYGPRRLTDIYLLALAAENGGRLVTFDRANSLSAARRAESENLVVV